MCPGWGHMPSVISYSFQAWLLGFWSDARSSPSRQLVLTDYYRILSNWILSCLRLSFARFVFFYSAKSYFCGYAIYSTYWFLVIFMLRLKLILFISILLHHLENVSFCFIPSFVEIKKNFISINNCDNQLYVISFCSRQKFCMQFAWYEAKPHVCVCIFRICQW